MIMENINKIREDNMTIPTEKKTNQSKRIIFIVLGVIVVDSRNFQTAESC